MKISLLKKEVVYFSLCFVFLTIFGTVSHEYGHIIVAKYLGYSTTLHYSSMEWNSKAKTETLALFLENKSLIKNRLSLYQSKNSNNDIQKIYYDEFLIGLGGISQTILTGSTSFIALLLRKRKNQIFDLAQWILILLSLFWLRPVFNLIKGMVLFYFKKSNSLYGGDEQRISNYLNMHEGALSLMCGLIGILIAIVIFFKIVPFKYRLSFFYAALVGSFAGFVLWMYFLGPLLLP